MRINGATILPKTSNLCLGSALDDISQIDYNDFNPKIKLYKIGENMKVKKALILAGGKGTRFLPYTKAYPKEMLAVIDKPALQLIVEEVVQAGITDVAVVISPEKQKIVEHFTPTPKYIEELKSNGKVAEAEALAALDNLAKVSFLYQSVPNGTGNAVALAEEWANGEPFAVLNGDDVMLHDGKSVTAQLTDAFSQVNKAVVGVQTVTKEAIKRYATCKVVESHGRLHKIDDIVEKPQTEAEIYSLLAPLGRYVVTSEIFDVIRRTPSRGKEVYLTDSLQIMAKDGGIFVYDFEGERFDFGDKLGYLKGVTRYALSDSRFKEQYLSYLKELINK